jgi:hypothetical protein
MAGIGSYSPLLKNSQLNALKTALTNGIIEGYSGTPVSAATTDPGVAPCIKFTKDGAAWIQGQPDNGVNLGTASNGAIAGDGNSYAGLGLVAATISWWRYYSNDKSSWIQGIASTSGGSLNLTTTTITVGGPVAITSINVHF